MLLAWQQVPDVAERLERLLLAYTKAVERVLGIAAGTMMLFDAAWLLGWSEALAPAAQEGHGP